MNYNRPKYSRRPHHYLPFCLHQWDPEIWNRNDWLADPNQVRLWQCLSGHEYYAKLVVCAFVCLLVQPKRANKKTTITSNIVKLTLIVVNTHQ